MKFKQIGKYLPGFSAFYYMEKLNPVYDPEKMRSTPHPSNEFKKHGIVKLGKFMAHILYGTAAFIFLIAYPLVSIDTGELNYFKQRAILNQRVEKERVKGEKEKEVWDKLFGKNGYADTNKDGRINLVEKINAYKKMGFKDDDFNWYDNYYTHSSNIFPTPTQSQLEKAVSSYESKD